MWLLRQAKPAGWRAGAWEWTVNTSSRFWRWYVRDGGWRATTLGWCILLASKADVRPLAVHAPRLVAQKMVLGPPFMPAHTRIWIVFGHEQPHPERDARAA